MPIQGRLQQIRLCISRVLPLSVSYRLDPEVQVQNPEGKHSARAGEKYLCILQHEKLQSSGAKCPTRSCASGSQDATKPERIGLDGRAERKNSYKTICQVSVSEEKETVGKPLLAKRLLRGFCRCERRDHPALCKAPR